MTPKFFTAKEVHLKDGSILKECCVAVTDRLLMIAPEADNESFDLYNIDEMKAIKGAVEMKSGQGQSIVVY